MHALGENTTKTEDCHESNEDKTVKTEVFDGLDFLVEKGENNRGGPAHKPSRTCFSRDIEYTSGGYKERRT